MELPRDIYVEPPPEPQELGGVPLVWLGPLSRIPSDSRGRWAFVSHCRWRLAHIRQARAEVTGADGRLSNRMEQLARLETAWRARLRLAEMAEPRLKFQPRFNAARYEAECDRLLEIVKASEQPPPSGETGQDFLDKLAKIVSGD